MPNLADSCQVDRLPFSIKQLARVSIAGENGNYGVSRSGFSSFEKQS